MVITPHAPTAVRCPRCRGAMFPDPQESGAPVDYACLSCGERRFWIRPRPLPPVGADLAALLRAAAQEP